MSAVATASINPSTDTLRQVSLDEVNVVASFKDDRPTQSQPLSATLLSQSLLKRHDVASIKQVGARVPNFFMPDYGSRQTSAIYIRGIGSRIGTPAVGLYVDDVPVGDKSGFDFALMDVAQIDVLRGPQSTLYGSNTMGGLVRVHTRNPFEYQGTDIRLSMAPGPSHVKDDGSHVAHNNEYHVSAFHHHRVNDLLAFSVGVFQEADEGFFYNRTTEQHVGGQDNKGARLCLAFRPTARLKLDAIASYEHVKEDAYPYFYTGAVSGPEQYADEIGYITAGYNGAYRRDLSSYSLNAKYLADHWQMQSVTSYQYVNDRMDMDQDFLAADIYRLQQQQRLHTLNEELIVKSRDCQRLQWLTGASLSHQWGDIAAPVTFMADGLKWLNALIADKMQPSQMPVSVAILGSELPFDNGFETTTTEAALFGQTSYASFLGIDGLTATLGLRFDYEHHDFDYDATYAMQHSYAMPPRIDEEHELNNALHGHLASDHSQLLPRLALQYSLGRGHIYAAVSRGFRSGGYNAQSFSEPMQQLMQTDLMKNVRDITLGKVPPQVAGMVSGVFDKIIVDAPLDIDGTCAYKPEYATNYEVGTHLPLFSHRLTIDATVFYSQVTDQQLTKMSATGLGRTVVNAGSSQSFGAELAVQAVPVAGLTLNASIGLTNATFDDYALTDAAGNEQDCHGNHVPYMPSHTYSLDAEYAFSLPAIRSTLFAIGADLQGVGRIYWDEANAHHQSAYALLGAHLRYARPHYDLTLWGRNLTDTSFSTFWFETMGRGFSQQGHPLQLGVTATVHF